MKKGILLFGISLLLLFSFGLNAQAVRCDLPHEYPPGSGTMFTHPEVASGLVRCGQYVDCQCQLSDLGDLILQIYDFLTVKVAAPLAGLMVVIGGIMLIVSGGNPGLAERGKKILIWSAIAMVIILASYIIVDFILRAIGYTGNWSTLPF